MYLNAVIFAKLQTLYQYLDTDTEDPYFLSFAPTTITFSNFDFNFLNPNTTSADEARQNDENKMAFAQIANAVVRDPKFFQLNTDQMISDAYGDILKKAILVDTQVSAEDKAAYNKARAVLFVNDNLDITPGYAKYKEIQGKVADLDNQIIAVNKTLSEGDISDNKPVLQQKQDLELQRNVVLNDWMINGNKNEIEDALKVITSLNEKGLFRSNFNSEIINFGRACTDAQTTASSNISYLPTFCLPQSIYQYNFNGWKKVTLSPDELLTLENNAKAFLGEDMYNANNSATDAPLSKLEFEYLFVKIQRNWFKTDIVNSRFWKFQTGDSTVVSDGTQVNTGILPAVVDKFIFVRRVLQYFSPKPDAPPSEVNNPAPPTYKFSQIAQLTKAGEFSKLKTIQPVNTEVSKIRMTNVETKKFSMPFILESKTVATEAAPSGQAHSMIAREIATDGRPATGIARKFDQQGSVKEIQGTVFSRFHFPGTFHPKDPGPAQPTSFSITFAFTDGSNPVSSLDLTLTNVTNGGTYTALSDNTGKISFAGMPAGNYHLQISNNEMYEDFESTYNFNAENTTTVNLQKRANPKFDLWVIGTINYQFPKLPNPLNDYTYS